jgi:hypothetical protein
MKSSSSKNRDGDQLLLISLFEKASARVLQVNSLADAEAEIVTFLKCVQEHPEQRQFIVDLFINAVLGRMGAWEVVQFCLHTLRWPEMQKFIHDQWLNESKERGARTSKVWEQLLAAFEDNWEDAEFFRNGASHSKSGRK